MAAVAVVVLLVTRSGSDGNVECSGRVYSGGHPAIVYGQGLTSRATAAATMKKGNRVTSER